MDQSGDETRVTYDEVTDMGAYYYEDTDTYFNESQESEFGGTIGPVEPGATNNFIPCYYYLYVASFLAGLLLVLIVANIIVLSRKRREEGPEATLTGWKRYWA